MTLLSLLRDYRQGGLTVACCTGCFDLLHPGHLHLFEMTSSLADIVVVGLNSDASIRRLKGPDRPLFDLLYRTDMIAGLRHVDYVSWFAEDNPSVFLSQLKPEFYVKGSDHRPLEMPERQVVESYGGKIIFIQRQAGYSTTGLCERL